MEAPTKATYQPAYSSINSLQTFENDARICYIYILQTDIDVAYNTEWTAKVISDLSISLGCCKYY